MSSGRGLTRRDALLGSLSSVALAGCGRQASSPTTPDVASGSSIAAAPATHALRIQRQELAPDGFTRSVLTVNGQYPGPLLRVRKGDPLAVAVENATTHPTTNHYHGQYLHGAWRMDGVPGVSAPAIPAGETFTARFTPNPGGTFWYHSHALLYNGYPDGQYGPLIVDDPDIDDLHRYDQEAVLLINDWFHETADEILMGLLNPPKSGNRGFPGDGDVKWVSALINGKGRYRGGPKVPLERVEVEQGSVTRFRIINASSTYELVFSIDDHPLTVFATDGLPIKPLTGDAVRIPIGGRCDLLVEAKTPGTHWIRVRNGGGGEGLGVFRYKGSSVDEPKPTRGRAPSRLIQRDLMESLEPMAVPDDSVRRFDFSLTGSMNPYVWTMSGQRYPVSEELVIQKGDQVRVLLRNQTMMPHPFHLHGHGFWVLGDPSRPQLRNRPKIDTVLVPAKGQIAIQFAADNPGKWIFHCHIDWHMATGMARVFRYESIDDLLSNTFAQGALG
ncbi:MAG: multicopper oxidase family protein [Myxococcota bacterium]